MCFNYAPLIRVSSAFIFTILNCCLEYLKVLYLVLEQAKFLAKCLRKEALNQGFK